jgi:peptide/nickel transport system substrate-binding protein
MKTTRRTFMSGVAAAGAAGALPLDLDARARAGKDAARSLLRRPGRFRPANIFRIENENIAFNIFSGLTTYDSQTGKIIPDLAESWETKDNINWTFKLRRA